MKKLLLIALLIVGMAFTQNENVDTTIINNNEFSITDSLDWHSVTQSIILMPVSAKTKRDNDGNIIGTRGLMIMPIGYYSKNYFKPLKVDAWNTYWQWGTIAVLPYCGFGTEYIRNNGFFFGIGTFMIVPEIHFGKYF